MQLNDSQLDKLLHELAGTENRPTISGDLAGQVRRRYFHRRRAVRLGGGLVFTAVIACVGIFYSSFILLPSSFPPPSPALSLEERIERLDRRLDQLAVKIGEQQRELGQIVEYKKALDSAGPRAAEMTEYGMALQQRIQAEQAGYMLVGLGEDYLALSQPDLAVRNFKKVLENYPDTVAAVKAKKKLEGLGARD